MKLLGLGLCFVVAGCGGGSGPADAARDALGCTDEPTLMEEPSRQTVRFEFSGPAGAFVAVEGVSCLPFSLEDPTGAPVALGMTYEVVCANEPPPRGTVREALPASDGPVITWDARQLVGYRTCVDCAERFRDAGIRAETATVWQPVGPGRYRARFIVIEALPFNCTMMDGRVICTLPGGAEDPTMPARLCEGAGRTVFADFDLPDSGDVTVPVVIE